MSRYLINVLASQDLNDIADYFAENNVEAGERFFTEFNKKCAQLVMFPRSGRQYKFVRSDVRGLSFRGYVILYRLIENGIEILRVLNARRNFPAAFEEFD